MSAAHEHDPPRSGKSPVPVNPDVLRRLRRARRYLREHYAHDPVLKDLAAVAHFSKFHFHREFTRAFGITPKKLAMRLRIAAAKRLLREGETPSRVARAVGFAQPSHFGAAFRRVAGMAPLQWLRADLQRDRERDRERDQTKPAPTRRRRPDVTRAFPLLLQLAAVCLE